MKHFSRTLATLAIWGAIAAIGVWSADATNFLPILGLFAVIATYFVWSAAD